MPEPIMKALATITEPSTDDSPHGGFTAVLSTPSLDRDGDRLARDEWSEPLPDKITLDVDHLMTAEGTIGSARPYFDDDGNLMIDARFASTERAQQVRSLIREGHLDSVSVAFLGAKTEKGATPRRELLNAAVVSIPSNRDARILSAKAFEAIEAQQKAAKDDGPFADPGYLDKDDEPAKDGNGVPRYSLSDEEKCRAAWSYINQERNAERYTAAQLQRIREAIKTALRKYGVKISEDEDDKKDEAKSFYGSVTDLLAAAVTVKAGARNSASDSKMIQAIHDASNLLGAQCVSESAPDVQDGASEGANKSVKSVGQMFVIGKSMTGSVEDLRDRIQCALNDVSGAGDYGGRWACILATYMNPDGKGGSVVYSCGGETLCRAFADDGTCVSLDSNIQAVTLVTSVAAIPDTVDGDPTPLPPAAAEAGKSYDRGGELPAPTVKTNTTGSPVPVLSASDIEDFKAKLDALTKTSGHEPGSSDSPADSPVDASASPDSKAASKDPADDESADDDDAAADDAADDDKKEDDDEDEKAKALRARLLMTNAQMALVS